MLYRRCHINPKSDVGKIYLRAFTIFLAFINFEVVAASQTFIHKFLKFFESI